MDGNINSSTFGYVTHAAPPRISQVAAKIHVLNCCEEQKRRAEIRIVRGRSFDAGALAESGMADLTIQSFAVRFAVALVFGAIIRTSMAAADRRHVN